MITMRTDSSAWHNITTIQLESLTKKDSSSLLAFLDFALLISSGQTTSFPCNLQQCLRCWLVQPHHRGSAHEKLYWLIRSCSDLIWLNYFVCSSITARNAFSAFSGACFIMSSIKKSAVHLIFHFTKLSFQIVLIMFQAIDLISRWSHNNQSSNGQPEYLALPARVASTLIIARLNTQAKPYARMKKVKCMLMNKICFCIFLVWCAMEWVHFANLLATSFCLTV